MNGRTWDDNREAINQLWPTHEWSQEEAKLVREDLSPLDQPMLYDAIRNAKRKHDTPFVHLKWLLDEYRELARLRKHALKSTKTKEEKLGLSINDETDESRRKELVAWIDLCQPQDFDEVERKSLDYLPQMHSLSCHKVLMYARSRLLGQDAKFGRVNDSGEVEPIPLFKKDNR